MTTTKSYDNLNRLLTIDSQPSASGAAALRYAYTYNAANQRTRVTLADGTLTARYAYGPFGEPRRATGPQAANPFRFSTKYCDAESGFYYYGYRYYDPITGGWLNRDPIAEKGGLNVYNFVRDEPIASLDSLGRCSCGPNVARWFGRELINTINLLDQVNIGYKTYMGRYFGTLLWIKDHGLEIQYKKMSFTDSHCPATGIREHTVTVCGRCIHRSELGNIMLGFWISYLGHSEREMLAGGNWIDRRDPGEGPNDHIDVGGLAYGYYVGGCQKGRWPWPDGASFCDLLVPPYSQDTINEAFTSSIWRKGMGDPWGSMSKRFSSCTPCSHDWEGLPHPPISLKRKTKTSP